jgi:glyoxylase-like metal-dependent hydrolase (beta-lactamase superfamily II)
MFPTTPRPAPLLAAILCSLVPGTAFAQAPGQPPEPKAEIRTQQLRPGLHLISSSGGNVVVWSGAEGVVLVDDSVAAITPQLLEAVARVAPGAVRFVVNTHWHPDHTGGNESLARSGALVIAQDNARARMREAQFVETYDLKVPPAPKAAWPVITFADQLALHLNGDNLVAIHAVQAHTDGDVLVVWENANVVDVGDLFYSGTYPFIDLASGGSLAGVVAAIELVLARADAQTIIIPGHGPVSNRAELAAYRDMLVAVGRRVRELVEQGKSEEEVLAARPTADFDERYAKGSMTPERFVKILYVDLAGRR